MAAVARLLGARVERLDNDTATTDQLQGGWSRHSYVARLADGSRRIVRVRPPGALLDTSLELEYRVYEALEPTRVPTPAVHGLEPSQDTPFGGPFFVMSFVEGRAPNQYGRDDQAMLAADFDGPRRIASDMVETLAAIHGLDADALPAAVPRLGFRAVADRWRAVYEERRLVRDPVIEEGYAWLAERAPAAERHGLVHGDYRIGNALVHEGRLTAVLDWELVHVGDVRFDLGYLALARSAGKHLRRRAPLMGTFADQEWFLGRYGELTGEPVTAEELAPFQMLAIMMLLATQITAVWMHANGRTPDFRMVWARYSFPGLRDDMVRLMGW
jgi:aminoglycoside phosphotransferase (APT) family kinase protein